MSRPLPSPPASVREMALRRLPLSAIAAAHRRPYAQIVEEVDMARLAAGLPPLPAVTAGWPALPKEALRPGRVVAMRPFDPAVARKINAARRRAIGGPGW